MFDEEMKILQKYKEEVELAAKEMCAKFMEACEAISKFENVDEEVAAAAIVKCVYNELEKIG